MENLYDDQIARITAITDRLPWGDTDDDIRCVDRCLDRLQYLVTYPDEPDFMGMRSPLDVWELAYESRWPGKQFRDVTELSLWEIENLDDEMKRIALSNLIYLLTMSLATGPERKTPWEFVKRVRAEISR